MPLPPRQYLRWDILEGRVSSKTVHKVVVQGLVIIGIDS